MNLKRRIVFPIMLLGAAVVSAYWFLVSAMFCILFLPLILIQNMWDGGLSISFKEWWRLFTSFILIFRGITER